MLDLIKKAIGMDQATAPVRKPRKKQMDLLSGVLLLEAAHSDYECSEEEQEHVVETLRSMFSLPEGQVEELMELAHAEREQAVDMHQFTRFANECMTREEKIALLEGIWRIILADGKIDKHEEHFARKITDLLWLDHKDYIAAKKRARDLKED
jgi:uncharacterized tellurite resistance protein B-like protein